MLPSVELQEIDGALGIAPSADARPLAIIGPSASGPIAVPQSFARLADVVTEYGSGALVEAASIHIRHGGRVVCVRSDASNPGEFPAGGSPTAALVASIAGTATVALSGAPTADVEARVRVIVGGTVGTSGITYQTSLDGGATWSATTALLTDDEIVIAGVTATLGIGTLLAGDSFAFATSGPTSSAADLADPLEALRVTDLDFETIHVASPIDSAGFMALDAALTSMTAGNRYRSAIASYRRPKRSLGAVADETENAYRAAFAAEFDGPRSTRIVLCAGAARVWSDASKRTVRAIVSHAVASRLVLVAPHKNAANVKLGPLPVSIAGEHDESVSPGLDDAGALTLRTHEGLEGVYVTRPLLFSSSGSDYDIMPKRRVIDRAKLAARVFLLGALQSEVLIHRKTGLILESEALALESGSNAAVGAVLGVGPMASAWTVRISRTDNILSTKMVNGTLRVAPLGYPEHIFIEVGFENPANNVQVV